MPEVEEPIAKMDQLDFYASLIARYLNVYHPASEIVHYALNNHTLCLKMLYKLLSKFSVISPFRGTWKRLD